MSDDADFIISTAKGDLLDRLGQSLGVHRIAHATGDMGVEDDASYRSRILAHRNRATGRHKEANEVIDASARDLERHLAQVVPMGLRSHIRVVVTFSDGTVKQVDVGDPPTQPKSTVRITMSDGQVIGEIKNVAFTPPHCPTPERHVVPGEGVCVSCDTRCACGHWKSEHARIGSAAALDGWKCTAKRPLNPGTPGPPIYAEDCRCEGFDDMAPCTWKDKCHGTMTWCARCGDVTHLCHAPDACDVHQQRLANKVVGARKEEAEW